MATDDYWAIHLNTLEDLIGLLTPETGFGPNVPEIIVSKGEDGIPQLEIYDGYRE